MMVEKEEMDDLAEEVRLIVNTTNNGLMEKVNALDLSDTHKIGVAHTIKVLLLAKSLHFLHTITNEPFEVLFDREKNIMQKAFKDLIDQCGNQTH